MFREVATFLGAALPLPVVVDIATITVETDQIHTTATLEVELTAPFIADIVQRIASVFTSRGICTFADSIDSCGTFLCSLTTIDAGISLCKVQVCLCYTHQEEVCIRECSIFTCATVCLEVGKLSNTETALESRNVIIIQ